MFFHSNSHQLALLNIEIHPVPFTPCTKPAQILLKHQLIIWARYHTECLTVVRGGRTLVITTLVWLYVVVVVILMGVLAFESTSGNTYEWNVNYKFYYAFLAVHIALPLLIIRALYYKIYKKAVENRQQLLSRGQAHQGTISKSDTVRETRPEVKMAKTVGFVFMFLVIAWIPVLILEIFYATGSQSGIIEKLGVVSLWLTCSNGMINPVVYSLRNKDFRHAILQLIHCKRPRSGSAV